MALGNFNESEDGSTGRTKTSYFQFENPDHPDSKEFDNPEQARRHYQAARFIQDAMGTNRHDLVGEFLYAVEELEKNDNEEPLKEFTEKLRA